MLDCCSVFALEPASARNGDCRAERLSDEMASLAMFGCVPVLGLMFELQQRRPPTSACLRSDWTAIYRLRVRDLVRQHYFMVRAQSRCVMTFFHPAQLRIPKRARLQ